MRQQRFFLGNRVCQLCCFSSYIWLSYVNHCKFALLKEPGARLRQTGFSRSKEGYLHIKKRYLSFEIFPPPFILLPSYFSLIPFIFSLFPFSFIILQFGSFAINLQADFKKTPGQCPGVVRIALIIN